MSSEANLWLGFIGISFKDRTKCVVFCILTVRVCVCDRVVNWLILCQKLFRLIHRMWSVLPVYSRAGGLVCGF